MHLLIAADNHDSRARLSALIEATGKAVTSVDTVADALWALASERFDLAIVDMILPPRQALQMVNTMRRIDAGVALLLCCRDSDVAQRSALYDEGADVVCESLPQAKELVARVEALLRPSGRRWLTLPAMI